MAELSYNDIQRAVNDATANLRADIQRINNDMSSVAHAAQRIDDIEREVLELKMILQTIQNTLASLRPGGANDQRLIHTAQDITELKQRFVAVERFATQMSEYMQRQHEQEQEDRQYRSA